MTRSARIGEGSRIHFHRGTDSGDSVGTGTGMGCAIQEGIEEWAGISETWAVRFE
jgi:hypothetical protein